MVRFAAGLVALLIAFEASAAQRTFVASSGADANACSRAAPCRSFAAALMHTDPSGEIVVLDSAGYGPVTIAQSVSIIAPPGVYAGISVATGGSNGIFVNGAKVVLRGLAINGVDPTSGSGIFVFDAGEVHIERCVVSNMGGEGIWIAPGVGTPKVHVSDTIVRSNGGNGIRMSGNAASELFVTDTALIENGGAGVVIESGTAKLDRVRAEQNAAAGAEALIQATGTVRMIIRETTLVFNAGAGLALNATTSGAHVRVDAERISAVGNGENGIYLLSTSGADVEASVTDSLVSENSETGIITFGATSASVARVTASAMIRNSLHGIDTAFGGSIESAGNNFIRGNTAGDINGIITLIGTQ
jgi:hypothetical protein